MSAPSGTSLQPHVPHHLHLPSPPRSVLLVLGVVAAWVVSVIGLQVLWQHGFGFTAGEALALSVGLMAYLALLIIVMGAIVIATRRGA